MVALQHRAHVRLTSAGERALLRGDLPAALNLFQRAAHLAPGSADRAETLTHVGRVLVRLGQLAEADALLEQALELARENEDELRAGRAEIAREFVRLQLEPEEHSVQIVDLTERLERVFDEHDDDLGLAHTWRLRSEVGRLVCRFAEEEAALEQALLHADAAGDEREVAEIRLWLGTCLCYGPTPVSAAIDRCRVMLEQAHGVRWVEASILGMLGFLHAMADDPVQAHDYHASQRRDPRGARDDVPARGTGGQLRPHRDDGRRPRRRRAAAALGVRAVRADRRDRGALDDGRDAGAGAARAGARATRPSSSRCTSDELAAADDVYSQLLWRSALAKVRARRDGADDARELAQQAVKLAAATDSLSFHGWALLDLARVEALLNGGAPPPELVAEAMELFERKQDAASLRRAAAQFAGAGVSSIRA